MLEVGLGMRSSQWEAIGIPEWMAMRLKRWDIAEDKCDGVMGRERLVFIISGLKTGPILGIVQAYG